MIQEKYSKLIKEFIKQRPSLSVELLEKEAFVPENTLQQDSIEPKFIFPILCTLAKYGLEIDGYKMEFDEADGLLTGRKWIENVETIEEGDGFVYVVKEYRDLFTSYIDLL